MPQIVKNTVGAITKKKHNNPELKALHHHVVHKRQEYHYHKKIPSFSKFIGDLKEKLAKKK